MSLKNERELANTQIKLARFHALYAERTRQGGDGHELHRLSMESLKRTINQFKEEIARYEARHAVGRS